MRTYLMLICLLMTLPVFAEDAAPRVIILGFDGVEPRIIESMLATGELPNLAKLRDQGGYRHLTTSNPPQSPTAWSTFATGTNPGAHGVYDFLRRTPQTGLPALGFGMMKPLELNPDGTLKQLPEYVSVRRGTTFWSKADAAGKRCCLIQVPYAYPPEPLAHGKIVCGLDVPDIRLTQSTYVALSDRFTTVENTPGGVKLPITFNGNEATVMVPGFRIPKTDKYTEAPLKITVDRKAHQITLALQGKTVSVAEGSWSDWMEWTFQVSDTVSVRALNRVYVHEAGEHVRLYMTCFQAVPGAPFFMVGYPKNYPALCAEQYGTFKTVGWSDDTKALQQDELTEAVFLDDANRNMAWTTKAVLGELDKNESDLLIAGWTSTDRIAHMFWRYRDPKHPMYTGEGAKTFGRVLEQTYATIDRIVGDVMTRLKPNDLLFVMSDHGFHSYRKSFSVNTWLVRNGYLALEGQPDSKKAYTNEKYMQDFVWNKTRVYGLGLSGIFVNLKGRESNGFVSRQDAAHLIEEIRQKLINVTDPETGEKIFRAIYMKDEIYKGSALADAPDLILGYADGYQTDKASAAGAAPEDIFSVNKDKWSGDHASSDSADTPGILFSNRKLLENPALIDIAPTTLAYLGVPVASDVEGKNVCDRKH